MRAAALEELAGRDRVLLQELLDQFARGIRSGEGSASRRSTSRISSSASATCCATIPSCVRESVQRFRSVMVDEFQDTNRLQMRAHRPARRPGTNGGAPAIATAADVFFVGDEFQSIYGFRHADVAVFRERRDSAPAVLPLTLNYRSRPEVLAVVNHLFAAEFGDGFQPLERRCEFPIAAFGQRGRAARDRQGELQGDG